jgi:hypothetical protein
MSGKRGFVNQITTFRHKFDYFSVSANLTPMIDSRKMSGCAVFKWGNTDDENAADSSVWLIAAGGIGDNGQVLDSVEGINWKISDDGNGTEWIKFGNLVTPRKAV